MNKKITSYLTIGHCYSGDSGDSIGHCYSGDSGDSIDHCYSGDSISLCICGLKILRKSFKSRYINFNLGFI